MLLYRAISDAPDPLGSPPEISVLGHLLLETVATTTRKSVYAGELGETQQFYLLNRYQNQ